VTELATPADIAESAGAPTPAGGAVFAILPIRALRAARRGAPALARSRSLPLRRRIALALALGFAPAAAAAEPASLARGAELLAPFKSGLQAALVRGLAEGPAEALAACRQRAPEIARAHSRDGVRVGRASHRLRNPANAAPDWVRPILDAYLADASDRAPRAVSLAADRSGYAEPILAQPLCLGCHGEAVAPALASRIRELYPADRATGFRIGDLRGVFWVEFPAAR